MSTPAKVPIHLSPIPGFCVKSSTANPHTLPSYHSVIAAGTKVFINICYDKNVPPPPPATEDAIKHAMAGQESYSEPYYVPVVVSQPRQDKDKAGNSALVFDCVYNSTLKSRVLRDSEFKIFLVELALQRIEAQTSVVLSRQIGTPNISAKGKLEPRTVYVPAWLAAGKPEISEENTEEAGYQEKKKTLIEEVDGPTKEKEGSASNVLPKLKGILKHSGSGDATAMSRAGIVPSGTLGEVSKKRTSTKSQRPAWVWTKEQDGKLKVTIEVSKETPYEAINKSTLDIESRRLILHVPESAKTPSLDLDLDLSKSDAEIVATTPGKATAAGIHGTNEEDAMKEPNSTLLFKRQRDFDVDAASAEWRVAEGKLLIYV